MNDIKKRIAEAFAWQFGVFQASATYHEYTKAMMEELNLTRGFWFSMDAKKEFDKMYTVCKNMLPQGDHWPEQLFFEQQNLVLEFCAIVIAPPLLGSSVFDQVWRRAYQNFSESPAVEKPIGAMTRMKSVALDNLLAKYIKIATDEPMIKAFHGPESSGNKAKALVRLLEMKKILDIKHSLFRNLKDDNPNNLHVEIKLLGDTIGLRFMAIVLFPPSDNTTDPFSNLWYSEHHLTALI